MSIELLDRIAQLDGNSAVASRRNALRQLGMDAGKIALAAIPFAAAGCAAVGKAIAPNTPLAIETLQFALLLEELEHDFYVKATASAGLIPPSDRAIFEQIRKHEGAHVTFLSTGITGIGGSPRKAPEFDFTAHGKYPGVFHRYETFLEVAQMLEDNGVQAYKGQAPNLMTSTSLLTAALRIHSVEARHAAEIRHLRGVKPWPGAFEEPATKEQILARTRPFIRKTG